MQNTQTYSLAIGINSTIPTLFVTGGNGAGTLGKIGIGTTDPQSLLDVAGTLNVDGASTFGNNLEVDGTLNVHQAVTFDNDLSVGDDLTVADLLTTNQFKFKNGAAANKILQSDATGQASWVDPMTLVVDDGDWGLVTGNDMYNLNSGNVGIGKPNPTERLDVDGTVKATGLILIDGNQATGRILQSDANGNASWVDIPATGDDDWTISGNNIWRQSGNVGIGINPSQYKFDLVGKMRVNDEIFGNSSGSSSKLTIYGRDDNSSGKIEIWNGTAGSSIKLVARANGHIEFFTNSTSRMSIHDEFVELGNPNTIVGLKVHGKIDAEEIEVHVLGWSDFVFGKDYKLKPLNEVEDFIIEHGHLPDVPSETEVLENGINVAAMNALLLQKIEELTLYVIELEKKIEKQNKQ